jgi:hypothetical protein
LELKRTAADAAVYQGPQTDLPVSWAHLGKEQAENSFAFAAYSTFIIDSVPSSPKMIVSAVLSKSLFERSS